MLMDIYDESGNATSYNNMDAFKTYFMIKDNPTYASYFKTVSDKRSEKELNKVSRNPLDYITEVYQNDRDLVKRYYERNW